MTAINDVIQSIKLCCEDGSQTNKQNARVALALIGGRVALAALAAFAVYASGVAVIPAVVIGACLSTTITLLAVGGSSVCFGVSTLIKALAATSIGTACVLTGTGILAIGVGVAALHFYRHKNIFSLTEYFVPFARIGMEYDAMRKRYVIGVSE